MSYGSAVLKTNTANESDSINFIGPIEIKLSTQSKFGEYFRLWA